MKKILSLILIMVLALSVFVGCGPKNEEAATVADEKAPETAIGILETSMEASQDMVNTEFASEMTIESSAFAELGVTEPIALKLSGSMFDVKNLFLNLDVEAGMLGNIAGSIYMVEDSMLIHSPMLAAFLGFEYVKADLDTIAEQAGTNFDAQQMDQEKIQEVLKRFTEKTDVSVAEILAINEKIEEVEVVIAEETVSAKKITMNFEIEKALDFAVKFIDFVVEDQEAQDVFFASLSEEEKTKAITELKAFNREEVEKELEALKINNFAMSLYVNEDFIPVKSEFDVDLTITTEGEEVDLKVNGFMSFFNINKVEKIVLPEVEEDQVLDLNDMN